MAYTDTEQLDEIAGVSSMAVSQWENGRAVPRMGSIQRMADYFSIPKSVIMGDSVITPSSGLVPVPLYGAVAAGTPIEMLPVDDMKEEPARFVDDDKDAYLVRVRGNSMNRRIQDTDYALVSPKYTDPNERDMFLVTANGDDATIEKVRVLANGIELVPDSYDPTYRSKLFDFGDESTPPVKIIGKIVWWCAEF